MYIFCDWSRNSDNLKGKIIMVLFRIASIGSINRFNFYLLMPYLIIYRIFVEWILGIEIPYKTKIGKGFILFHGQSTVINDGTTIGINCTIRHCCTLGNKQLIDGTFSKCPNIGDMVDIGSNVCIIGPVVIGHNTRIGAGSVVTKSFPPNVIIAGNPAKIINSLL